MGGGRGGGKSYALALLALRHCEQYGAKARVLYVRQTYKGVADFVLLTRELFGKVYGQAARYNDADHVWKFPNGAYLELGQLETASDYQKYQGRSFTLLMSDECGQYATPDLLDMLRSNLRGPKGMPIRVVFAANPGSAGHAWNAQRFVFKSAPWTPFYEDKSKRKWVYAPSTFVGNQFLDADSYREQLEASCPHDKELLRAWIEGDWTVSRGAYFASVLDESRNAIDPWTEIPKYHGYPWQMYLAHDWGSSAPSATYLFAVSPGATGPDERYYARGSLIVLDEISTALPDQPNKGNSWSIQILSEEILAMSKRWGMRRAEGVCDDACFAKSGHGSGSIAEEFARFNIYFRPARKADRVSGWAIMKRLLADAGKMDVPGLYISRSCTYAWSTIPYLCHDQKRCEDVDSSGPDHAADALRYGCLRLRNEMQRVKLAGI